MLRIQQQTKQISSMHSNVVHPQTIASNKSFGDLAKEKLSRSGAGPRTCISNKLPAGADATSPHSRSKVLDYSTSFSIFPLLYL